jgi:hypothetical protein
MGVSSGLPCSSARLVAAWTASCDLTVNLSQRIAISTPHLLHYLFLLAIFNEMALPRLTRRSLSARYAAGKLKLLL